MLGVQCLRFGAFLRISSYPQCAIAATPSSQQPLEIDSRIHCRGSLFLPFYESFDPAKTPRLSLTLGTNPYVHHVQMDTGSTGFLIDPAQIGGYDPSNAASSGYEAGYEYLSSSHRIYTGYWVPLNVTFIGSGTNKAVSQIRVLAVDHVTTCPWYRRADANICRPRPAGDSRKMTVATGAGVRYVREPVQSSSGGYLE